MAWILGAMIVGFIDLRFLAVPALGLSGIAIAALMAVIGIRSLRRGTGLGAYDLLSLAAEKEGGLLNIATIVKAYDCTPDQALRAMQQGVQAAMFEDVTPPTGKSFIIRSLASDDLRKAVEEGQQEIERAMRRLEADLSTDDPAIQALEAGLEAARGRDTAEPSPKERRERQ